jgi:hypothetical protein
MSDESKYPECEKLSAVGGDRRTIASFLEWCETKGLELRARSAGVNFDGWDPLHKSQDSLILEFLEVDENKLETERRAMLDAIRKEPT